MFDRFDICEAYNLIAHDFGLYDVKARLDRMRFRCAPSCEFYDGLSENARAIYDDAARRIEAGESPVKSDHLPIKPKAQADFEVENHGTIFLLRPLTDRARQWMDDHLPDDAQTFGHATVVEHRYIATIVKGMQDDDLHAAA